MSWPLEVFKQFFHSVEISRQPQIDRLYLERFRWGLLSRQSQTQVTVYHLLKRFSGFSRFMVQKSRDVIVKSESGAHIMMLSYKTS